MEELKEIPLFEYPFADHTEVPFRLISLDHPPTYHYPESHRHNYFEIFIFSEGTGRHLVDFVEYAIEPGTIHFVIPGQVHRIKRSKDSKARILLFSQEFFHSIGHSDDFPLLAEQCPMIKPEPEEFRELVGMSDLMGSESGQKGTAGGIVRSLLQAFLLKCSRHLPFEDSSFITPGQRHAKKFQQLLQVHFREWHFPSLYAENIGLTEKHLNEVIKESAGKSVGKLIRERIILEAKRLLFNTDWNAKEISYYLNFSDPAYFNRFFKGQVGITPQAFRQKSRKKYNF